MASPERLGFQWETWDTLRMRENVMSTATEHPKLTVASVHAYATSKQAQKTAKALVAARLIATATRKAIDAISAPILETMQARSQHDPEMLILKPSDAWEMNDSDAQEYYKRKHEAITAAGYTVPDVGYCPALMAEHDVIKAEQALLDLGAQHFDPCFGRIYKQDLRTKALNLLLEPFGLA